MNSSGPQRRELKNPPGLTLMDSYLFAWNCMNCLGTGFAGNFDYTAIECHGGSEKDLKDVVDFLTSDSAPAPMRLDNDRSYLCKLVSLNSEGRRYVWHSEFLTLRCSMATV